MNKMTYKDAGVDLIAGDDASKIMFNASVQTWPNSEKHSQKIQTPQHTHQTHGVKTYAFSII